MGRVFPVIESPFKKPNLMGKPLMEGFDSHYVLVKQAGNKSTFVPCELNDSPDYDEIIVANPSQVLPRFIVYYSRKQHLCDSILLKDSDWISEETEPEAGDGESPIPSTRQTQSRLTRGKIKVLIWVDDKPNDPRSIDLMKMVARTEPSVKFVQITSLPELKSWFSFSSSSSSSSSTLESFSNEIKTSKIREMIRNNTIRLVTNRKRMMDEGGEEAGVRLIEWVRSQRELEKLEIAMFCGLDRQVMNLTSESRQILVTDDGADVLNFMTFRPTIWPKK